MTDLPKVFRGPIPTKPTGEVSNWDKVVSYPTRQWIEKTIEPFEGSLRLTDMRRGRSAATAYFTDNITWPNKYPMMFANFTDAMHHLEQFEPEPGVRAVRLVGWFYFRKQGANFGLVYAGKLKSDIPK